MGLVFGLCILTLALWLFRQALRLMGEHESAIGFLIAACFVGLAGVFITLAGLIAFATE